MLRIWDAYAGPMVADFGGLFGIGAGVFERGASDGMGVARCSP